MTERLVVVGGDAAGMSAAAQARRRRDETALEIVAFERGAHTSYAACGIPYFVGDLVRDGEELVARSPEEHRRRGVDVHLRHEVVAVDTTAATVTVRDLERGTERAEPYDHLVIATGARPVRPPLPGIDAEGVYGVQTLDDGIEIRAAVDAAAGGRAVVVGGGYIGLEMAEALVLRGYDVTLVHGDETPMRTLDPDMGALVADALRDCGVTVELGHDVVGFDVEGGRVRAVRTDAAAHPADIVVLGIGVRPNGDLAAAAGIAVGDSGGVSTDTHMRTDAERVYAAGDCVETWHRVSRRPVAIPLGTHANKQGRVVGINVTGGDATFPGVVGTAVTKVLRYEIGRTGLSERQALALGIPARSVSVDARTKPHYYPESAPIRVKLVVAPDGRLLGAQIVGMEGAAKRVDVLATCIWNEMTVEEIINLDLGYAPPFSPVWDPVLVAARRAAGTAD